MTNNIRTHNCGELRIENVEETVTLYGWVNSFKNFGQKKFVDLRDRYGITQIVFAPEVTEGFDNIQNIGREFLLSVKGIVKSRIEGQTNKNRETGEIEVIVKSFKIENKSEVLPFGLDKKSIENTNEDLRLEYRYLDLRRPEMQKAFINRSKFIKALSRDLDDNNFVEIETPMIAKSTPEGARDMLIPSRKYHGSFYALPQSPQLYKQLLMVSGFDRYYQIARCFRDEDSRKDRQLEFTQLDLEMSFTSYDELRNLVENSFIEAFKVYNSEISHEDFETISYDEAIERFGSDKPDYRINGMELKNISNLVENCDFGVFSGCVKNGGEVKGMCIKGVIDKYSRKKIESLQETAKIYGAKGLAFLKITENGIDSPIIKFFTEDELNKIVEIFDAKIGDVILFVADKKSIVNDSLDALRRQIAVEENLIDESKFKFVWINDFPLFQWDEENNRFECEHSPFSMPNEEARKFIEENINSTEDAIKYKDELLNLKADCYDLAMNGVEICSGALRIHVPELQKKIFQIINMSQEKIDYMFGWFLKAYNYGAPSHRGLAFGLDRIVMMLEGAGSIRDVIAFPKNKNWFCPLTQSPSKVDDLQLIELGIEISKKE